MTHADAERAIFIDFEKPKGSSGRPAVPALLGVLDGEHFEQVIVDERLASARVAHRRCRVASLRSAASQLVDQAVFEGRQLVGWSFFDRDRLVEALPDRSKEIEDQYVNALHIARPWRRIIYPDFSITAANAFAPTHTLDQYARLAGYKDAAKLDNAAPAQWINDTLDRLAKVDGRYPALSKTGKRDWHRLLEYNRHDCLALRHIVLRATNELDCWRAYERTRFCVNDNGREMCFVAGSKNRNLEALLRRHHASRWAFITAWNPASKPLSTGENDRRQQNLVRLVGSAGYHWLPGEGRGADATWPPEQSLFILGISEGKAVAIGRKFGQLAIVVGRRGDSARLVSST